MTKFLDLSLQPCSSYKEFLSNSCFKAARYNDSLVCKVLYSSLLQHSLSQGFPSLLYFQLIRQQFSVLRGSHTHLQSVTVPLRLNFTCHSKSLPTIEFYDTGTDHEALVNNQHFTQHLEITSAFIINKHSI